MTYSKDDERYMSLALQMGRRGLGQVWPNPAVGCVIVRDGRIVGRGRTMVGGRPHAEVTALAEAGNAAEGAVVYVTLEPCAHHGKTPPCADALIDAKVAKVVIATGDPDPRVSGRGIAMLKAAGIQIETGILKSEADRDHQGFFQRVLKQRPFLTLKLAVTLDGRIATRTGESQWITGPAARTAVHGMRARHDAVMVGAGTMRSDDPQLTVRGMGSRRQPARVIVSSDLNFPLESRLFQDTETSPVLLCHGPVDPADFTAMGAESLPCGLHDNRLDLNDAMKALAARGITRVFCEGGGGLAASLLRADLVDRLEVFQAGKVIGGDGIPAVAPMDVSHLIDAARFSLIETRSIGDDVLSSWNRS